MILTCGVCGHRGEDGKEYNHDCYWVFRERGNNARMTKRGYSRDFTPKTERRIKIEIDRVPPTLADALRAKVKRDGLSVRSVTLNLWKQWIEAAK